MTAEIAVLNKSAVALAADSKVTIGSHGSHKTYDTVNKIFTLSKVHPVGIMIFGNASFMDHPWETIIKLYRSKKRRASHKTINLWAEDFFEFLKKYGKFKKEDKIRNLRQIIFSIVDEIEVEAIYEADIQGIALHSPEYRKILIEIFDDYSSALGALPAWATQAQTNNLFKKYGDEILEAVGAFVDGQKDKKLINAVVKFVGLFLISERTSPQSGGIVIAGFGSGEIFPAITYYSTDGYVGDGIKMVHRNASQISTSNASTVTAFAQHEIVDRFMEGIDPAYSNFVQELVRSSLIETNRKTFERWAPKAKQTKSIKEKIDQAVTNQFDEITKRAKEYRSANFARPIIDMVAVLPKEELAHLAESLVGLTSLHRRVSRDIETVGGPIDVAVISKSDGFIWIKRKHYFQSELNPHFVVNYQDDLKA